MTTTYQIQIFDRLEPRTPWTGGRLAYTDVLTLEDAARVASKHARTEITPADFLRAAGRGEIRLSAIVHRRAKVHMPGGGICINAGHPTDENVIPKGAIPTLPVNACRQLAAAGRASWRTCDRFAEVDGVPCRYTQYQLTDDEPDFETTTADCRLTGYCVHALADAFLDEPAPKQTAATPAPVGDDSPANQRSNKSKKTLIFEAKVLELMGKFWDNRATGTKPTKGNLSKQVYDEMLRGQIRGERDLTEGMVRDAAKPWKFPLVVPAFVPEAEFNHRRHPFKGDR